MDVNEDDLPRLRNARFGNFGGTPLGDHGQRTRTADHLKTGNPHASS